MDNILKSLAIIPDLDAYDVYFMGKVGVGTVQERKAGLRPDKWGTKEKIHTMLPISGVIDVMSEMISCEGGRLPMTPTHDITLIIGRVQASWAGVIRATPLYGTWRASAR